MKTPSLYSIKNRLAGRKTRLRAKRPADAERDYQWQTDAEMAYLDATLPLKMTYANYLVQYLQKLSHNSPTRRLFAIETTDGEHIGNLSYYAINRAKGEAELGIMIGQHSYRGKGYGTDAVHTILCHIFINTALKRIILKTLKGNTRAQKCFLKCGFTPFEEKKVEGHYFLLMEMDRDRWLELSKKGRTADSGNGTSSETS